MHEVFVRVVVYRGLSDAYIQGGRRDWRVAKPDPVKSNTTVLKNISNSLVWFNCLFVHPCSHTCNIGYVNYRLQFIYYNITYNIWTSYSLTHSMQQSPS
jgi:hypothetical protein